MNFKKKLFLGVLRIKYLTPLSPLISQTKKGQGGIKKSAFYQIVYIANYANTYSIKEYALRIYY